MPLGYHVYPDIQMLFIRGQGTITQRERVRTMLSWLRDPQYDNCIDALFDISSADSTPKPSELRELISILQQRLPATGPRKLAIVTARPITFIVAQVFESLMRFKGVPIEVKVFFDRELAWSWLRPDGPPLHLR